VGAEDILYSLIGIDCLRRPWTTNDSVDFMPSPAKMHPDPELKAPIGVRAIGDNLTDLGMQREGIALSPAFVDHDIVDVFNPGGPKYFDDPINGELRWVAAVVSQLSADSAFD